MGNSAAPWFIGAGGGATTFTRHQAQRFARDILESRTYRDSLETRAAKGDLPPAVETMLWHYAYGKPLEQVAVSVDVHDDLGQLSAQQLAARALQLTDRLRELQAMEDAIPAEAKTA